MQIKYGDIFNPRFQSVVRNVANEKLPFKTAYALHRILDTVQSELNSARGASINVMKKYCKLDEKGDFVMGDHGPQFIDADHEAKYRSEESAFMEGSFEVKWERIPAKVLEDSGIKISASDLAQLLPIVSMGDLEVVK